MGLKLKLMMMMMMMMIFLNWPTHRLADCDVVWLTHRSRGERFARVGPGCRCWPASDDWRRHRARHSTAQNQRRVSRQACRAEMTMSQRVKWVNASVSIASVKRRIVANLLQSLSVKIVKKIGCDLTESWLWVWCLRFNIYPPVAGDDGYCLPHCPL